MESISFDRYLEYLSFFRPNKESMTEKSVALKEWFFYAMTLIKDPSESFDLSLRWQGILTGSEIQYSDQERFLLALEDSQKQVYYDYQKAKAKLHYLLRMENSKELESHIKAAHSDFLVASKKANSIPGFKAIRFVKKPSLDDVCIRLGKERASLLQYVAHPRFVWNESGAWRYDPYYTVFTVHPHGKTCTIKRSDIRSPEIHTPIVAWVNTVKEVERCVASGPSVCTPPQQKKAHRAMHEAGKALRKVVWAPFEKELQSERVYIVPDGALNQVSFASLADDKDTFLIEQKTLRYIPYAAALDAPEREEVSSRGALFVGDLDYDRGFETPEDALSKWQACSSKGCGGAIQTLKSAAWGSSQHVLKTHKTMLARGVEVMEKSHIPTPSWGRELTPSWSEEKVYALMGSQTCGYEERAWSSLDTRVEDQASRFAKSTGEETLLVRGSQAHEQALRENMKGRRVLHLATHGFFSPKAQCAHLDTPEEDGHLTPMGLEQAPRFTDPLQLSALVLSGGNKAGSKLDKPEEDGLLSAREVVRLDLRGTEVVTLAACETGLGQNTVGEGSLGLARAFLVAGAKTAFVSHWQVPLADTNALFQRFYADAFPSKGKRPDVVDAYHQVVRASIKQYRMDGNIHSAFFWAAFFPLQIQ